MCKIQLSDYHHLTNPRQRVSDEHVYHPCGAETSAHEGHPRSLPQRLGNDLDLFLTFGCVQGFESGNQHSLYETFRSSLSAIQTLIMD